MKFNQSVVGGTFDLFHAGHKKLLQKAFEGSEFVTIGLSLPSLSVNKPFASLIQDYTARELALREYLIKHSWEIRATIIPIADFYGTTLTDVTLEAIFVTNETKDNGDIINVKRIEKKLPPLSVIVVDYEIGDAGDVISSRQIREGLINREGVSYQKLFKQKNMYTLPIQLRELLQKPHGETISDSESLFSETGSVISIGDVVSSTLRDQKFFPAISIIDGITQRAKINELITNKYFPDLIPALANAPGTINSEIAEIFLDALKEFTNTGVPQIILVNGEEDLLALPAILLSPLGSVIIYGQHNVGMIKVLVTEKKKEEIRSLLDQF